MLHQILPIMLFGIMILNSTPLTAASFNCTQAKTEVEKAICNNRQLSEADSQMGSLFVQLLKSLSTTEANQLRQEQRNWLKRRDQECPYDNSCILQMYQQRIAELSGKFKSLMTAASFNCTQAKTEVEKAICNNRQLSEADSQMGSLFVQLLKSLSTTEADQLRQEQRNWLKRRNQECPYDDSCLLQMYQQRIAELSDKSKSSIRAVYGVVATQVTPLNIREGRGKDTRVIGKAPKGAKIRILNIVGDWYRVQLDTGIIGYANGNYVKIEDTPSNEQSSKYPLYGVINTRETPLNVREGMGMDMTVIDKAPKGARVIILGMNGNWYRVQLDNGIIGYASKDYVEISTDNAGNSLFANGGNTSQDDPMQIKQEDFIKNFRLLVESLNISNSAEFIQNLRRLINNPKDEDALNFFGITNVKNSPDYLSHLQHLFENKAIVNHPDFLENLKILIDQPTNRQALEFFGIKVVDNNSTVSPDDSTQEEIKKFITQKQAGENLMQLIMVEGDINFVPSSDSNTIILERSGERYEFNKDDNIVLNIVQTIKQRIKPDSRYITEKEVFSQSSYNELIQALQGTR
ncbi:MAG: hypothetical protein BWK78_00210 [Thiotrichaceae bacterium IS1]|nr:MAG: hypothetical protein BWK78_00210 [Thiotrichaceae bacterium IS1]